MSYSLLGKDKDGNKIEVNQGDRPLGMYLLGTSGMGKSTLIESLVLQDAKMGVGFCLLDPHGDLVDGIIQKLPNIDNVILLDIHNTKELFGLNPYECANPSDPLEAQSTVEQVINLFELLYDISRSTPQMVQTLRNVGYTILANNLTIDIAPEMVMDQYYRAMLLPQVTMPSVRSYWQRFATQSKFDRDREINAFTNKTDELLGLLIYPIIAQQKTTVRMAEIMDSGKILLVKLDSRNLKYATQVIGSLIVAQIVNAASQRRHTKKRKQFNVYADEFANFATHDFQVMFEECRKWGVTCTVAHQTRAQLSIDHPQLAKAVLGSATKVVFKVISPTDTREMAASFDTQPPQPKQEEVGRRAIRIPATDVARHFLNKGSHPNPVIIRFIQNCRQMMQQAQQRTNKLHPMTPMGVGEDSFLLPLNDPLREANVNKNPNTPLPLDRIEAVAGILGFSDCLTFFYDNYRTAILDPAGYQAVVSILAASHPLHPTLFGAWSLVANSTWKYLESLFINHLPYLLSKIRGYLYLRIEDVWGAAGEKTVWPNWKGREFYTYDTCL